ncbi:hypothetical protein AD934_01975 [Gluconobacter oxydans]|uniref:Uncharacterized protein n=2 Tax=Gluconobacter oxydans TaxID=442 RepID=A0A149S520_GLUOY|nr:hypothetical protein AD934_01975 [Gluconobacter oxydans]
MLSVQPEFGEQLVLEVCIIIALSPCLQRGLEPPLSLMLAQKSLAFLIGDGLIEEWDMRFPFQDRGRRAVRRPLSEGIELQSSKRKIDDFLSSFQAFCHRGSFCIMRWHDYAAAWGQLASMICGGFSNWRWPPGVAGCSQDRPVTALDSKVNDRQFLAGPIGSSNRNFVGGPHRQFVQRRTAGADIAYTAS